MQQIISRSCFANLAGVADAAVTKAAQNSLKAACVGSRIDVMPEAAQNYLQKQRDRRLKAPEFCEIWEFCLAEGMPDLPGIMSMFRLNEADAQRAVDDLLSLGLPAPAYVRGHAAIHRDRFGCRVAGQTLLAGLQERLRPTVIQILIDAFDEAKQSSIFQARKFGNCYSCLIV